MPLPSSSALAIASFHFHKKLGLVTAGSGVLGAPNANDMEMSKSNMSGSQHSFKSPLLTHHHCSEDQPQDVSFESETLSNDSSVKGIKKATSHTNTTRSYYSQGGGRNSILEEKSRIMRHSYDRHSQRSLDTGEVVDNSKQQALLIWAGLLIDAIPESFVIGFMVGKNEGSPLTFIVGVFLSNFPEAMSSSGPSLSVLRMVLYFTAMHDKRPHVYKNTLQVQ
jgi:zinc transporter ZupT